MDLTQYKIEKLIKASQYQRKNSQIFYENLKFCTAILVIEALLLCPFHIINPIAYLVFDAIVCPVKIGLDYIIPEWKKKRANQKLREVVSILSNHGININTSILKKARTIAEPTRYKLKKGGLIISNKNVVFFQDREEQLKVLKQVRVELISLQSILQKKALAETRIIEGSEIKTLYLDMKK